MKSKPFAALVGFLSILEAAAAFVKGEARVTFKETLEVIGYASAVGGTLVFDR